MEEQLIQEKRKQSEAMLSNIYNLPAMSSAVMEVSKLLDDPSTNAAELGRIIGKDQGMSTKILSIANSPLYGLPRKVSTIDFAILIIGYQDIKNIVVALTMVESFKNKSDKYFNQADFWKHSIITGSASKRIAEDLGYRIGSEAFVAGLLHDLGIPVMHKYFNSAYEAIANEFTSSEKSLEEIELEQVGMTHSEIGKFLSNKWKLPVHLCETIEFHHKPKLSTNSDVLTAVVHLADYMTQYLELGNFYLDDRFQLDESIFETLKINESDLEGFMESYRNLFIEELNSDIF